MQFDKRLVLSHVDLRVRDRARATAFYTALLGELGHAARASEEWTSFVPGDETAALGDWIGFTEDAAHRPNETRVALSAQTCEDVDRVTTVLPKIGALNIEGPDYEYGPEYYAVFFDDPDGNKLEVCCIGPRARAAS